MWNRGLFSAYKEGLGGAWNLYQGAVIKLGAKLLK